MASTRRLVRTLVVAAVLALPLVLAGVASAAAPKSLPQRAAMTDLPGDPLSSPFYNIVNASLPAAFCKVYNVSLNEGDMLAVRLNADAPKGIYMGLLPTGTIDLFDDFVAVSETDTYPQLLRYRAPVTGTYYVIFFATTAAPANTMLTFQGTSSVTSGDVFSDIPGQPLHTGGFNGGHHAEMADWADVYSVALNPGEALHLRLDNRTSESSPCDTDLYLFDSRATSIYGDADPVAESTEPPQEADQIVYLSPNGGQYYASTWAYGNSVDYTLESTITPPTGVTCAASKNAIPYGGYVSIWGQLLENGVPLGAQYVHVQGYSGGFKTLGSSQTAYAGMWPWPGQGAPYDPGTYKLTVPRTVNTRFRSVYGGTFFKHSPSASAYQDVYVSAWLPTPGVPSPVYHGRAFTAYGYVKPRHAAGTYPVQLVFEHLHSGKVAYTKRVNAKASNYSAYTKYAASVSLPYAGAWRVRAFHKGDAITATSGNAATYSSYRALTAR
jgi:hypothetical protein